MAYLSILFCVFYSFCQPTSLSRRSGCFRFEQPFGFAPGVLDWWIVDVFVFQLLMRISASQPLDISASQPLYRQTFVLRLARLAGNLTKVKKMPKIGHLEPPGHTFRQPSGTDGRITWQCGWVAIMP